MYSLFIYNWQVRDEWFEILKDVPHDELLAERNGGLGSILKNLFHIIDVEYSWIRGIEGYNDPEPLFEDYSTLERIQQLSNDYRHDLKLILDHLTAEHERTLVTVPWDTNTFQYGEILRHVVVHEVHHIGQLSVWANELGIERVSANFIGRGLVKSSV